MGPASELGPIDPQQILGDKIVSVHHIIDSYHKLFRGAARASGNLEPYLQQLGRYDAANISHLETERDLVTDMAVELLHTGMLSNMSKTDIKKNMQVFLLPKHTKAHGRPIYHKEAIGCGLNIELHDPHSSIWNKVYELNVRSSDYVSRFVAKAIETSQGSSYSPAPPVDGG